MPRTIFGFVGLLIVLAAASNGITGAGPTPRSDGAALQAAHAAPAPGAASKRVSPLSDPRGIHPGLTPVPPQQLARARSVIQRVRTAPAGTMTGYSGKREELFGQAWTDDTTDTWGHNGCRTREDILRRDLSRGSIEYRAGTNECVVLTGYLQEPYTGRFVTFTKADANAVQIDHIIPLGYVYRMGGSGWTQAKRQQIANDPRNLAAVDGPANMGKGDDGPADWMPPNARVRCAYSVRWAQDSRAYDVPVTGRDKSRMLAACQEGGS